jgi:hypothetical protein
LNIFRNERCPLERYPVQILHDDEGLPILLINLMDRADVEMIQSRSSFGFAPKTGQCLRVFGDIIGQELKGYEASLTSSALYTTLIPTPPNFSTMR